MTIYRVMLTGTYDLFHAGHAPLLKEASKLGDEAYVGCDLMHE